MFIGASLSEPHTGGSRGPLDMSRNPKKQSHVHKLVCAHAASCNVVLTMWITLLHVPPPAMSDNVPETAETKQDRLRKRRKQDRLRRERETPEERDARFVNASPTCLPYILIITVTSLEIFVLLTGFYQWYGTNEHSLNISRIRLDISIFTPGNVRKTERWRPGLVPRPCPLITMKYLGLAP